MSALQKFKRKLAAVTLKEMRSVERAYDDASKILIKIIDESTTIPPEDKQQRKWDSGNALWEYVYKPYYTTIKTMLEKINEVHEPQGDTE